MNYFVINFHILYILHGEVAKHNCHVGPFVLEQNVMFPLQTLWELFPESSSKHTSYI